MLRCSRGISQGPFTLSTRLLQKLTMRSNVTDDFDIFGHELCRINDSFFNQSSANYVGLSNETVFILIYTFTVFYIFYHYSTSCQKDYDNRYCKYLKNIYLDTYITEYQTSVCNLSCQMCFERHVYSPESCSVIW